jgi:hypothetical protein
MHLKECGRKRSLPNLRYYIHVLLEELRNITKGLSRNSWFLGPDLNVDLPSTEQVVTFGLNQRCVNYRCSRQYSVAE